MRKVEARGPRIRPDARAPRARPGHAHPRPRFDASPQAPEHLQPRGRHARGRGPQEDHAERAEEQVRQPDGERRGQTPAERHALEGGEQDVVGDHDDEARGERDRAAAPMAADAEREAHEHEDERGHGQREALVQLDVVGRGDLRLRREVAGRLGEPRAATSPSRASPPRPPRRAVTSIGQGHVVEAEGGVAEAPGIGGLGLVDRRRRESAA